jgi:molecular chaperone DnaK (HSP70)
MIDSMEQVIRDAQWSKDDIEETVLADRSTCMPRIKRILEDYFGDVYLYLKQC